MPKIPEFVGLFWKRINTALTKTFTKHNLTRLFHFIFSKKFIVGVASGALVVSLSVYTSNYSKPTSVTLNRANSENELRNLFIENTFLLTEAAKSMVNNRVDYDFLLVALDANTLAISQKLEKIYDEETIKPLFPILKHQNDAYLHYASDMYGGFTSNAANELPEITYFPDKLTNFFGNINVHTNKSLLKNELGKHVADTKTFIDAYLSRDYLGAYAKEKSLIEQATTVAETIMDDAAKMHPEKFAK